MAQIFSALSINEKLSQRKETRFLELGEEAPLFQSHIAKSDLVHMIIDALRFRVKWPDIERGLFFYSPAMRRIAKLWYERTGLRYVNAQFEEMNQKVTNVKTRKAEKLQGRVRRKAILMNSDLQSDLLEKLGQTKTKISVLNSSSESDSNL